MEWVRSKNPSRYKGNRAVQTDEELERERRLEAARQGIIIVGRM